MVKYILVLFLIGNLNPSFAQSKHDNAIMIAYRVTLGSVKSALFKNGYVTDGSDTSYMITNEKVIGASGFVMKIMIARTDTVTYIKGVMKNTVELELSGIRIPNSFTPIEFKGAKGSISRKAWDELNKIATLLDPDVQYFRE